jgi:hypothetical protein
MAEEPEGRGFSCAVDVNEGGLRLLLENNDTVFSAGQFYSPHGL